jgi:transposase-like protein
MEELAKQGLEGLPELVRVLVNEAMRIERENYLNAKPYERTEGRRGYASGLQGVQLIISDDHPGIQAARQTVFTGVPWERCQFHLRQNVQAYIPRVGMRRKVAEDIRTIFIAPDRETTEIYLQRMVKNYANVSHKLAIGWRLIFHKGL